MAGRKVRMWSAALRTAPANHSLHRTPPRLRLVPPASSRPLPSWRAAVRPPLNSPIKESGIAAKASL